MSDLQWNFPPAEILPLPRPPLRCRVFGHRYRPGGTIESETGEQQPLMVCTRCRAFAPFTAPVGIRVNVTAYEY